MEDFLKSLESAKASVKGAFDTVGSSAFNGARTVVETSRKVEEEGTPMRRGIKVVRESANDAIRKAHGSATDAAGQVDGMVTLVRSRLAPLDPIAAHADELRKSRPEALVGLITAPVVLLSVFGGKVAMARNGLSCACAAGLAVYGATFWEQRK